MMPRDAGRYVRSVPIIAESTSKFSKKSTKNSALSERTRSNLRGIFPPLKQIKSPQIPNSAARARNKVSVAHRAFLSSFSSLQINVLSQPTLKASSVWVMPFFFLCRCNSPPSVRWLVVSFDIPSSRASGASSTGKGKTGGSGLKFCGSDVCIILDGCV